MKIIVYITTNEMKKHVIDQYKDMEW